MQDCKTLNAKVQVVAWLSTSTQLVSAFLELWMFVDDIMSLETPSFLVCVQTESEVNLSSGAFAYKVHWEDAIWREAQIGAKMRPQVENVSAWAKELCLCHVQYFVLYETYCCFHAILNGRKSKKTPLLPPWGCSRIIPKIACQRLASLLVI